MQRILFALLLSLLSASSAWSMKFTLADATENTIAEFIEGTWEALASNRPAMNGQRVFQTLTFERTAEGLEYFINTASNEEGETPSLKNSQGLKFEEIRAFALDDGAPASQQSDDNESDDEGKETAELKVYFAGTMTLTTAQGEAASYVFALSEMSGMPQLVFPKNAKASEPDFETFRVYVTTGETERENLLLLGGDSNAIPTRFYQKVMN